MIRIQANIFCYHQCMRGAYHCPPVKLCSSTCVDAGACITRIQANTIVLLKVHAWRLSLPTC
jgi:hypothetical protein